MDDTPRPNTAMRIITSPTGYTITIGAGTPSHFPFPSDDVATILHAYYTDLPDYLKAWQAGYFTPLDDGWVYLPF